MGKNNRQRRAAKRRERGRSSGPAGRGPTVRIGEREVAEMFVFEAAEAAAHGDADRTDLALRGLVELGRSAGRSSLPATAMTACLVEVLRSVWEGGWQPTDVPRVAVKRCSRAVADLAAQIITAEARTSAGAGVAVPEAWAVQLEQVADDRAPAWEDPEVLRTGAALLGVLTHLPVVPNLMPPPSAWGRGSPRPERVPETVDGPMLAKVRALLAKAESTDFEEEAGALTAKAQELMARHAIDHAMVSGGDRDATPCGRRLGVEDPYALGKANLLAAAARSNRCRTVWSAHLGFSTVFGFPADLDVVEVLYTSLLVQATRAMTAAGSVRDGAGRSRTRSFRQSFLIGFSRRIGERLEQATVAATEEAGTVHGHALLPVLAGRVAAVEGAVAAAFPEMDQANPRVSNASGWIAGRAAADMAHLGPEQQLLPGIAV